MRKIVSGVLAVFLSMAIACGCLFVSGILTSDSNPQVIEEKEDAKNEAVGDWLDYASSKFAGGGGTKSSPYLISNASEFAKMAKDESERPSYNYYKLTCDIDLSDHNWTPIPYFKAYLDGDRHTVKILNTLEFNRNYTSDTKTKNGWLSEIPSLKSCRAWACNVPGAKDNDDRYAEIGLGAFANSVFSDDKVSDDDLSDYAKLKNIVFEGNLSVTGEMPTYTNINGEYDNDSGFYVGGVVGFAFMSTLENVINRVNVTVECASSKEYPRLNIGGVVGLLEAGRILNCKNEGRITYNYSDSGKNDKNKHIVLSVGGIAGAVRYGFSPKTEEMIEENRHARYTVFEIIEGDQYDCTVMNCYNTGVISLSYDSTSVVGDAIVAGGVVGYYVGNQIVGCVNSANININGNVKLYADYGQAFAVGGVLGNLGVPSGANAFWTMCSGVDTVYLLLFYNRPYSGIAVRQCTNYGGIYLGNDYSSLTTTNCNVTVGGIVGGSGERNSQFRYRLNNSSTFSYFVITGCSNFGAISDVGLTNAKIGGIFGSHSEINSYSYGIHSYIITDNLNHGSILDNGTKNYVGGIVGSLGIEKDDGVIDSCINIGLIKTAGYGGGIISYVGKTYFVGNCVCPKEPVLIRTDTTKVAGAIAYSCSDNNSIKENCCYWGYKIVATVKDDVFKPSVSQTSFMGQSLTTKGKGAVPSENSVVNLGKYGYTFNYQFSSLYSYSRRIVCGRDGYGSYNQYYNNTPAQQEKEFHSWWFIPGDSEADEKDKIYSGIMGTYTDICGQDMENFLGVGVPDYPIMILPIGAVGEATVEIVPEQDEMKKSVDYGVEVYKTKVFYLKGKPHGTGSEDSPIILSAKKSATYNLTGYVEKYNISVYENNEVIKPANTGIGALYSGGFKGTRINFDLFPSCEVKQDYYRDSGGILLSCYTYTPQTVNLTLRIKSTQSTSYVSFATPQGQIVDNCDLFDSVEVNGEKLTANSRGRYSFSSYYGDTVTLSVVPYIGYYAKSLSVEVPNTDDPNNPLRTFTFSGKDSVITATGDLTIEFVDEYFKIFVNYGESQPKLSYQIKAMGNKYLTDVLKLGNNEQGDFVELFDKDNHPFFNYGYEYSFYKHTDERQESDRIHDSLSNITSCQLSVKDIVTSILGKTNASNRPFDYVNPFIERNILGFDVVFHEYSNNYDDSKVYQEMKDKSFGAIANGIYGVAGYTRLNRFGTSFKWNDDTAIRNGYATREVNLTSESGMDQYIWKAITFDKLDEGNLGKNDLVYMGFDINKKITEEPFLDILKKYAEYLEASGESDAFADYKKGDSYTFDFYIYYDLQRYEVAITGEKDVEEVVDLQVEGEDFVVNTDDFGSKKSYKIYYYQPVTLTASDFADAKFAGMYLNDKNGNLLTTSNEFKFANNPTEFTLRDNTGKFTPMSELTIFVQYADYEIGASEPEKKNGIYEIDSADDLVWLSNNVEAKNGFENCVFKQICDIDMSGKNFLPIGFSSPFKGTYDGEFKKIKNLNLFGGDYQNNLSNMGLFGQTDGATIKNLIIFDGNDVSGYGNVGVVVGNAKNTIFRNISNINVGVALAETKHCNIYGQDILEQDDDGAYKVRRNISGFVGLADGCSFVGCSNQANVSTEDFAQSVASLVGSAVKRTTVDQCFSENSVEVLVNGVQPINSYCNNSYPDDTSDENIWGILNGKKVLKIFYWLY